MSEPLWCEVRQHYCRCHDFGRRCDDFDDSEERQIQEEIANAEPDAAPGDSGS